MTELPQIRLTDDEIAAGAEAFQLGLPRYGNPGLAGTQAGANAVAAQIVAFIVAAINRRRGGDPIGTVRVNPFGTYVIRVCDEAGVRCWRWVHPTGKTEILDTLPADRWELVPGPQAGD